MASSSKPREDETPEEIMARRRMIVGGQHAGNLSNMAPGTEIMMNRDGSNGFRLNDSGDPSSIFKWNEKTGDYRSGQGGIARIAEIPQAAVAESGGGGGSEEPARQGGEVIYPNGQGEVMDTGPTGGYANWQDPMFNYQPITHGQHLNPLADPNQWVHTPEQQMGLLNNPGIYSNNPRPIFGVLS